MLTIYERPFSYRTNLPILQNAAKKCASGSNKNLIALLNGLPNEDLVKIPGHILKMKGVNEVVEQVSRRRMVSSKVKEGILTLLTQFKSTLQSFVNTDATDETQGQSLQGNMSNLVKNLVEIINNFESKKLTYEDFKKSVNDKLNSEQSHTLKSPNSPYYELHYAVASVFRGIFRLFDLGWIIGRKTMNETYTPFAKTFTGNNHFFELPQNSMQKEMAALTVEVHAKMKNLDDLCVAQNSGANSEFRTG